LRAFDVVQKQSIKIVFVNYLLAVRKHVQQLDGGDVSYTCREEEALRKMPGKGITRMKNTGDKFTSDTRNIDRTRAILMICAICAVVMIVASVYQAYRYENRQYTVKAVTITPSAGQ
jgi:hypothetical protein